MPENVDEMSREELLDEYLLATAGINSKTVPPRKNTENTTSNTTSETATNIVPNSDSKNATHSAENENKKQEKLPQKTYSASQKDSGSEIPSNLFRNQVQVPTPSYHSSFWKDRQMDKKKNIDEQKKKSEDTEKENEEERRKEKEKEKEEERRKEKDACKNKQKGINLNCSHEVSEKKRRSTICTVDNKLSRHKIPDINIFLNSKLNRNTIPGNTVQNNNDVNISIVHDENDSANNNDQNDVNLTNTNTVDIDTKNEKLNSDPISPVLNHRLNRHTNNTSNISETISRNIIGKSDDKVNDINAEMESSLNDDNKNCADMSRNFKSNIKNKNTKYVDTSTTSNFDHLKSKSNDDCKSEMNNDHTKDFINSVSYQNGTNRNGQSNINDINIATNDTLNCEMKTEIENKGGSKKERKKVFDDTKINRKEGCRKKRFDANVITKEQEKEEEMKMKYEKAYQVNNDIDRNEKMTGKMSEKMCRKKEEKELITDNIKSRADEADRMRAERVKQLSAELPLLSTSSLKGFLVMR